MEPKLKLIAVGDIIINPAHVAYAERNGPDFVTLHMAVNVFQGDSRLGAGTGHTVLTFRGDDAKNVWWALERRSEDAKE